MIVSEEIGLLVLTNGIEVRCAASVLWCQVCAQIAIRSIFIPHFNNESISYIQDIVNLCFNVRAPETAILLLVAGRVFACHQKVSSELDN